MAGLSYSEVVQLSLRCSNACPYLLNFVPESTILSGVPSLHDEKAENRKIMDLTTSTTILEETAL